MSRRVVGVTGANGFVGRRLCAQLEARGDTVVRWDLPDVNMLDTDAVNAAVSKARPSVVFYLAATGLAHERAHDPSVIDENVKISVNVVGGLRGGRKGQRGVDGGTGGVDGAVRGCGGAGGGDAL